MKFIFYTGCFLLIILSWGACNKADVYEEKAKTLDSLSGAISLVSKQLENTDTLVLQRSLARYVWYKQFIEQNIHDTISKEEADYLYHFYNSGKNLENFAANRKVILTRGKLVSAQLMKLAEDARKRLFNREQLDAFLFNEKQEVVKVIEAGSQQQKIFHSGMEEFKNALRGVELLIRRHNKGELPVIIKDTISL